MIIEDRYIERIVEVINRFQAVFLKTYDRSKIEIPAIDSSLAFRFIVQATIKRQRLEYFRQKSGRRALIVDAVAYSIKVTPGHKSVSLRPVKIKVVNLSQRAILRLFQANKRQFPVVWVNFEERRAKRRRR